MLFGGILIIILNFLSGFFLSNSLWIQPKCWFNKARLFVWFGAAFQAYAEAVADSETYGTSLRKKRVVGNQYRY